MLPMVVYETLSGDEDLEDLGITNGRILELQSVDERPYDEGYFVILNWQESTTFLQTAIKKAPRILTVWVHTPKDTTRDYRIVDRILNRIDNLLLNIEQQTGSDSTRVTCVMKQGRSGNLIDDGWKTIARNATYGVLYDEYAV